MEQEQKKFEEVTLYNFVSLRSPQNREKGDEDMQIDFIFCNIVNTQKEIDNVNNAKSYNSYAKIIEHPEIAKTIEVGKILNEYKYKEINFHRIHQSLCEIEFEEGCVTEILQITWKALVKLTKYGGELKYKEALINILRIFHFKKHIKLISDSKYKEDIPFYNRLINAQVVIPQELLPKIDTFFFGEKLKQFQVNPYSKERARNNHDIAIVNYEISNLNLGIDVKKEKEDKLIDLKAQNKFLIKTEDSQYDIYKTPIYCTVLLNNLDGKEKGVIILSVNDLYFKDSKAIKSVEAMVLDKNYAFGISDVTNPLPTKQIVFDLSRDTSIEIIQKEPPLNELTVSGFITLIDDTVYQYEIKVFIQKNENTDSKIILFYGENVLIIDDGTDFYGNAFAPSGYGIKQLGISEYRKVVSTISRYVPAEVAKIENVMASEYREMATVKELTKEVTDFESTESSKETETESISTDRFQMQNEIAQIFATENTGKFDTKASYGADSTKLEISYGTSTKDSKNESNRQAVTNAKEITNKAVEKIFTKVRKERTVKVTEKYTESNKHGFDNRGNTNHVSGVYRHINAVYRNQIYNYGRRLMYEFAIPEPALFHHLNLKNNIDWTTLIGNLKKPILLEDVIKNHEEITESNVKELELIFGVDLDEYPKLDPITHPLFNDGTGYLTAEKQFLSKENYYPFEILFNQNANPAIEYESNYNGGYFIVELNGIRVFYDKFIPRDKVDFGVNFFNGIQMEKLLNLGNSITVKCYGNDLEHIDFNMTINFKPNSVLIKEWKKAQYDKLEIANKKKRDKYEEDLKKIIEENPIKENSDNFDKDYVQHICLRKQCISYLISDESQNGIRKMGQNMFSNRNSMETLKVNMGHTLNEYTAFARFLEQAFDWNLMSYTYYPFYWADINEWERMYKINDTDDDFNKFLKAGMARVLVSVRPGFEKAVMQYMLTGKIWEGGEIPTYGSSLFLSIAAEINENPEYKIEKTWDTILPTNLIALQSSGVAINQEGLPNLEKSQDLGEMVEASSKFPRRKKFLGLF